MRCLDIKFHDQPTPTPAQVSALAELSRVEAKMMSEADYHHHNKGEDKTTLRSLEADYDRALAYARNVGVRV